MLLQQSVLYLSVLKLSALIRTADKFGDSSPIPAVTHTLKLEPPNGLKPVPAKILSTGSKASPALTKTRL